MNIGILPAAGTATRLGGLPKFLLPLTSSGDTLLRRHIDGLRPHVEQILIPTRPENAFLLAPYIDDSVTVLVLETATMSETVLRSSRWTIGDAFIIGMPDTFFSGSDPYRAIADELATEPDMVLAVWEIEPYQRGQLGQVSVDSSGLVVDSVDKDPECVYPLSWGALGFHRHVLEDIDSQTPHVGYSIRSVLSRGGSVRAVLQTGKYIDSGTPQGFRSVQETVFPRMADLK